MRHPQIRLGPPQIAPNLHETPHIPREHRFRIRLEDILGLAQPESLRHLRLGEVIAARGATADFALVEREQLQSGNHLQQLARLLANLLGMAEVASVVIDGSKPERMFRLDGAQRNEELSNV